MLPRISEILGLKLLELYRKVTRRSVTLFGPDMLRAKRLTARQGLWIVARQHVLVRLLSMATKSLRSRLKQVVNIQAYRFLI